MPVLATAKQHFDEDIERARQLFNHALAQNDGTLKDDIARSAWMMGVGAIDAFYSDVYADLLARTLQAKQNQSGVSMPKRMMNIQIPVFMMIRKTSSDNWKWRVAARQIIEKTTVLSFKDIKNLLNQFCREGNPHKLFSKPNTKQWILHVDSKKRHFGITKTYFRSLSVSGKNNRADMSLKHFEERFDLIFQRRHDCIHNCDRPKIVINRKNLDSAEFILKVLYDIEFLAHRTVEHFQDEYPKFLRIIGFNGVTRNRVCQ